ncbi:tobamovirus multiplication protein 1-like isoform X1 [Zingiber officinale]|uniref:tobamovirus multiplication protein 1-like isoform X1 n=2 Tax=Zingiber officinale TaxID=94328 RepID=UPI001C4CA38C|nr:tobamovirus multiplication protein 1-like isoform X1 [Zingiber officinale]
MRREGEAAMRCLPKEVEVAGAVLSAVDGAVAVVAFVQLFRIHLRNQQLGWTRQKIFHLMIGSSNIGYLAYFISALIATCEGWRCWSHGCGFAFMACPQIIFIAAFLLLISFWVDLCHQASDDEEEDYEPGCTEALLDKSMNKQDQLHADGCRVFCFPRTIHVGNRQKFVILVIALIFISMIAFSILIWIGGGKNPIDSPLVARVYLYTSSVAMLLLGGAFACYGTLLFSKMSKVRSEMTSTEMWKVASLAAVTVLCFTSSAVLAVTTTVPLEMLSNWHPRDSENLLSSVFVFLYYFIGSTVPSGFVLWVMREMPPSHVNYTHRTPQSTVVTFIRERDSAAQNPQWRDAVTSLQNKGLKSSPI